MFARLASTCWISRKPDPHWKISGTSRLTASAGFRDQTDDDETPVSVVLRSIDTYSANQRNDGEYRSCTFARWAKILFVQPQCRFSRGSEKF